MFALILLLVSLLVLWVIPRRMRLEEERRRESARQAALKRADVLARQLVVKRKVVGETKHTPPITPQSNFKPSIVPPKQSLRVVKKEDYGTEAIILLAGMAVASPFDDDSQISTPPAKGNRDTAGDGTY